MNLSVQRMHVLLYRTMILLGSGMTMSISATAADIPPQDFTRIAWLSSCDNDEAVTYFFLDLLPDGVLRYEGVTDTKILGSKEEQLDNKAAKQLRLAVRDFLAGKARTGKDEGGPTFCVRVQVYNASRVVDSQSELIFANQRPLILQRIDEFARAKKWACPVRLSSTRSGAKSARFCEEPAFMMAVAGRSACDVMRHVEVYANGAVYIGTRAPPGDRSIDHSFYEIDPAEVAQLVERINSFKTVVEPALFEGARPIYRRMDAKEIDEIKSRLSELTGEKWLSLEGASSCEPSGATSEVSLRRDLDHAMNKQPNNP